VGSRHDSKKRTSASNEIRRSFLSAPQSYSKPPQLGLVTTKIMSMAEIEIWRVNDGSRTQPYPSTMNSDIKINNRKLKLTIDVMCERRHIG